jgi:hypothetical protein
VTRNAFRERAAEHREEDQQDDHGAAHECGLVLLEAHPEELPWASPDDLDLDVGGREILDSRHVRWPGRLRMADTVRV